MAALPPVQNVFRNVINATLGGVPYANVFHTVYSTGTAVQADAQAMSDGIRAAFKAQILPQVGAPFILGSVVSQDLTSATAPIGTTSGSDTGAAGTLIYPNNVAMCVSLKVNRRYKGGKGRMYLGGFLSGNQSDSSHWAGPFLTTMTTRFGAFLTAVNAITSVNNASTHMVIVHYVKDKIHLPVPLVDQVTGFAIDSRIDTQRRRLG